MLPHDPLDQFITHLWDHSEALLTHGRKLLDSADDKASSHFRDAALLLKLGADFAERACNYIDQDEIAGVGGPGAGFPDIEECETDEEWFAEVAAEEAAAGL